MKKLSILFLLAFVSLNLAAQTPDIAGKNIFSIEAKQGFNKDMQTGLYHLAYERQIFRSSLFTAHGIKYAFGIINSNNPDISLSDKPYYHQLSINSFLGVYRHFLNLELGTNINSENLEMPRLMYVIGYRRQPEAASYYYSIGFGNLSYFNVGLGIGF